MLGAPARCDAADDEGGVGDVQQRVSPAAAGRETALRSCAHDTAREVGSRAGGGELRARDGLAAYGASGRFRMIVVALASGVVAFQAIFRGRRASAHGLRSARVVLMAAALLVELLIALVLTLAYRSVQ